MATFDVLVEVSLRPGIADPQGATVERALPALGFDGVHGVRVGKAIRFTIEAADEAAARGTVEELGKRFLSNPVIEDSRISLVLVVESRAIPRVSSTRMGRVGP